MREINFKTCRLYQPRPEEQHSIDFPSYRKSYIIWGMDENLKIYLRMVIVCVVGSLLAFRPQNLEVSREYIQYQEAYQANDYQEMALNLVDLAQLLPWQPELWEKAGHLAQRAQDYNRAVLYFEHAKDLGVLSQEGRIALGEVYNEQGVVSLAEENWSAVEDSPRAARYLAELHQETGEYAAAVKDLKEVISLVGEVGPEVHFQLGLLLAAEDPLQAVSHLEKAGQAYPEAERLETALAGIENKEPAYRQVLAGRALASLERWELAKYAFQKAVRYRPDYPLGWAYLGEALQQVQKEGSEPLPALEEAYALDPDSPVILIFLGTYWQRKGEHQKALSFFEDAEAVWPDNPDVYIEQGRSLGALGELDAALSMYEKAIQKDPENPTYYRLLAKFCLTYRYRIREMGLPAARQAVQRSGESPASLLVMGQVMAELDDAQNAKKFFIRALAANPTYAEAHFSLGMTYLSLGENELADRHLQAVLRHSSNPALSEQARQALATFSP